MSERISEDMPADLSDRYQKMSERMSQDMSERKSNRTLGDMPEKLSETM